MEKTKEDKPDSIPLTVRMVLGTIQFIILIIALILPLGAFSPFSAGDQILAGGEPSVAKTLLWLIPLEAILLATVYLLNPISNKK